MISLCRHVRFRLIALLLPLVLLSPIGGVVLAEGSTLALVRLLQILRDRGSITVEEYEELRLAATEPAGDPAPAVPVVPVSGGAPAAASLGEGADATETESSAMARAATTSPVARSVAPSARGLAAMPATALSSREPLLARGQDARVQPSASGQPDQRVTALEERVAQGEQALRQVESQVKEQGTSLARLQEITDGTSPALVSKALAGKWYERIGLRGYTQFRVTDVVSSSGSVLEVPNDRSVNENESFLLRRGRFVFSGDVSDHLYLYAQSDFNGSTGASEYSLQMRDLYADISLDRKKEFRVRLGQSKVPYGFVNLQSSQNRAPLERPDGINSAVEGERDLGAYLMWAPTVARQRFRELVSQGLKGSGDYGVLALGVYSGQGLNRSDQNGHMHTVARWAYPFKLASGQFVEVGVQGYRGRFVSPIQAILLDGAMVTPSPRADGVLDQRVGVTAVWYPQPIGVEAEWNIGKGPELSADARSIESASLHGGYVMASYRRRDAWGAWFPFARWNYFDGARKFARNAPRDRVNEVDFGLEFARWLEVELTAMYTHSFERTRTGSAPYGLTRGANRVGFQVQWNY